LLAGDLAISEHKAVFDHSGELSPEFDVGDEIDSSGIITSPFVDNSDGQIKEDTADHDDDEDPPNVYSPRLASVL